MRMTYHSVNLAGRNTDRILPRLVFHGNLSSFGFCVPATIFNDPVISSSRGRRPTGDLSHATSSNEAVRWHVISA